MNITRELGRLWTRLKLSEATSTTPPVESAALLVKHARDALLSEDEQTARDTLRKIAINDKLHVETFIEVHDQLIANDLSGIADSLISIFIEERDAQIFREINAHVSHLRQTDARQFPIDVQIETLTKCNADCSFCQYGELTRIGDRMTDETFRKIIDDLKEIPETQGTTVTLYGVNEPFLDKRIWDFMRIISDELPHMPIALNTNGAPLNEERISQLTDYNIARLSVSLNEYRKQEYYDLMKIDFDRTVEVIHIFNEKKGSGEITFPVGVTRAGTGTIDDFKFISWVTTEFPNLSFNYSPRFDWVDESSVLSNSSAVSAGCTHWFDMTIRATGDVSFCCIDGHNKWPKGNVTEQNLLEIYNLPEVAALRSAGLLRTDVKQCQSCRSG